MDLDEECLPTKFLNHRLTCNIRKTFSISYQCTQFIINYTHCIIWKILYPWKSFKYFILFLS